MMIPRALEKEKRNKRGKWIFFLNRRCPVGCPSCNTASALDCPVELSPAWLTDFFERIHAWDCSDYILWTGGEPFLSFKSLQKGIELATQKKFHSEILTSGVWFNRHPEYLERLAATGSFSLRISLDAEHQNHIPLATIFALVKKALSHSIEINFTLRDIPGLPISSQHYLAEIKKHLPDFFQENHTRSRWLHSIPHMPIGPATNYPHTADSRCRLGNEKNEKWKKACKMGFTDPVIGEDGLLYPCCGIFSFPHHRLLAIGNPLLDDPAVLEKNLQENRLLHTLKLKGPYGVGQEIDSSFQLRSWPDLSTPCQLCMILFYEYGEKLLQHYATPSNPSKSQNNHPF